MSDIQKTVAKLRLSADYLALHAEVLDATSYEVAIAAWRANHPDRGAFGYPEEDLGDEALTYASVYVSYGVSISVIGPRAKELTRRLRRELGGKWEKHVYDTSFRLNSLISKDPRVPVTIETNRDAVCVPITERKAVTVPAQEAVEAKPAVPEHTEVKEVVVDYDCGNLLTDDEPDTIGMVPPKY